MSSHWRHLGARLLNPRGSSVLSISSRTSNRLCRYSSFSSSWTIFPCSNRFSDRWYSAAAAAPSPATIASVNGLEIELAYLGTIIEQGKLSRSPTAEHDRDCRFEELLRNSLSKCPPGNALLDSSLPWRVYTLFRQHGRPNAWAYRQLLTHCLDAGDMQRFDRVRKDMAHDGVRPDVAVVNVLLARCLLENRPLQPVVDEAKASGVVPNRETFLIRLQAYASRGLVNMCVDVLDEMVQRSLPLEPDDDVFRLMAEAARKNDNQTKAAKVLIDATRRHGLDNVMWAKVGLPSSAKRRGRA